MSRPAPFAAFKIAAGDAWVLQQRFPPFRSIKGFRTLGDAIDYAHRHWPWWP